MTDSRVPQLIGNTNLGFDHDDDFFTITDITGDKFILNKTCVLMIHVSDVKPL